MRVKVAKRLIELIVNGDRHELAVEPWRTLAEALREDLDLTGAKIGCNQGQCGACTVLLQGRSVNSCLVLAVECHQREITTIEGLAPSGQTLHPLQESFVQTGAASGGYGAGGMIMSAADLLTRNDSPGDDEIRAGLAGNLCCGTGYDQAVAAVSDAAQKMPKGKGC